MRIVLLTPEYPPAARLGGIGTNTAALAPVLAARGHDVTVIAPATDDIRAGETSADGVHVRRLHARRSPEAMPGKAIIDRLLFRLAVARQCRALRPDVVHAAEWEALAWAVTLTRTPVVTRLATPTYVVDELNGRGGDPATKVLNRWERTQARRSARVYAPTGAIVDRVATDWKLDLDRVHVVPNPVDIEGVLRSSAAEPPFPVGPNAVVFTGRIERRKGIDTLAAALELVLRRRSDATAVLIGREVAEDRDLAEEVRSRLAPFGERVVFAGELAWSQALAVVARAAVVALPSVWESFGYVCVEAMALGRPVVATDTGGFAEIVKDDSGFLVPIGDVEALASQIVVALEGGPGIDAVRAAAVTRSLDFDVKEIAPQVESVLRRAVAGSKVDRSLFAAGYREHFRPDDSDPFAGIYARKRDYVLEATMRRPRQRIVDVGGGFGRISGPLAAAHDMILCDLSPEMLQEARERTSGDVALVRADALRLPVATESADGVIALDLLVHLDDVREGLDELRRIVRPGGWLLVDSTNAVPGWVLAYPDYVEWRPRRLVQTLRAGGVLPEWTDVVHHQHAREMRAAIDGAGLDLTGTASFGPRWCPKWHLWQLTRR